MAAFYPDSDMPKVLERKLNRKARKTRKESPAETGQETPGHPSCANIIRREGDHEMSVILACNRNAE